MGLGIAEDGAGGSVSEPTTEVYLAAFAAAGGALTAAIGLVRRRRLDGLKADLAAVDVDRAQAILTQLLVTNHLQCEEQLAKLRKETQERMDRMQARIDLYEERHSEASRALLETAQATAATAAETAKVAAAVVTETAKATAQVVADAATAKAEKDQEKL